VYAATQNPAHRAMAERCAAAVEAEGAAHWSASLCHGVAGNAGLFLALYRATGAPAWLERARAFGEVAWGRRILLERTPAWRSGDEFGVHHPGLLTGTPGVAWLYLQLAEDGRIGEPVTG